MSETSPRLVRAATLLLVVAVLATAALDLVARHAAREIARAVRVESYLSQISEARERLFEPDLNGGSSFVRALVEVETPRSIESLVLAMRTVPDNYIGKAEQGDWEGIALDCEPWAGRTPTRVEDIMSSDANDVSGGLGEVALPDITPEFAKELIRKLPGSDLTLEPWSAPGVARIERMRVSLVERSDKWSIRIVVDADEGLIRSLQLEQAAGKRSELKCVDRDKFALEQSVDVVHATIDQDLLRRVLTHPGWKEAEDPLAVVTLAGVLETTTSDTTLLSVGARAEDVDLWSAMAGEKIGDPSKVLAAHLDRSSNLLSAAVFGGYVLPLLGIGCILVLATQVAALVTRVRRWSDRIERSYSEVLHWTRVASVLAIVTLWLPAAHSAGWYGSMPSHQTWSTVIASTMVMASVALLMLLTVRLRASLRRNRREA